MTWYRRNSIIDNLVDQLRRPIKKVILTNDEINSIEEHPKIQQNIEERNSMSESEIFYKYYHDLLSQGHDMEQKDIFKFDAFIEKSFFEFISERAAFCYTNICSWKSCKQFENQTPKIFLDWMNEHFKIISSLVKVMYSQKIIKNKIRVPNPEDFQSSYPKDPKIIKKLGAKKDKETGVWKTKLNSEKYEAYNLIDFEKCPYRNRLGKILLHYIYNYTNISKHPFKGVELHERNRLQVKRLAHPDLQAQKKRKTIIRQYSQALSDIDYIYKNK
jgi:hypothetical protein